MDISKYIMKRVCTMWEVATLSLNANKCCLNVSGLLDTFLYWFIFIRWCFRTDIWIVVLDCWLPFIFASIFVLCDWYEKRAQHTLHTCHCCRPGLYRCQEEIKKTHTFRLFIPSNIFYNFFFLICKWEYPSNF